MPGPGPGGESSRVVEEVWRDFPDGRGEDVKALSDGRGGIGGRALEDVVCGERPGELVAAAKEEALIVSLLPPLPTRRPALGTLLTPPLVLGVASLRFDVRDD